ncbi:MAG: chemotaxis protein CheC [Methanomicrobiales archaeon]|nr:chemotaxis protein CheC [Methanomicrobiales archaeon]
MDLSEIQLDALRELGNIGAAHAATALSQLMNCSVEMSVPEIHLVDIASMYSYIGDDISAIVAFQIQGDLGNGGYIVLHMPEQTARRMTALLLGTPDNNNGVFSEMHTSTVIEIGNIMVSAFLDGTAGLLNILMLPSPPAFVLDMPHAAIDTILASQALDIDEVLIFRTELSTQDSMIRANILLLPHPLMLHDILHMLGVIVAPSE